MCPGGTGVSFPEHLVLGFVTSEAGEDRAGLAATETPRRPRGLRRVS